MKKLFAMALVLSLTAGLLTGCVYSRDSLSGDTSSNVVNVYNWGEYIDESVLKDFEAATGIKVNYQMYDSNETMYSKIAGGGANYDVVIPSDYMVARLIEEDLLAPLNFDNIPNFADIDPALKNPAYDPENLYSVPYMWGLMGVIYNTKAVDEEDLGSWDLLWNEKYAGDILMIDNSRDAIGIALKRLGYSYNTTDESQVRQAVDLLVEQWPIVQAYVMDDIFQKLEGANAYVGTYYYGDYLTMYENNPDLGFYIPEEGTNIYVDAMCILKDAPNKENAEAFINYMCSTQAGLKNCEAIWYSSPLLSVREELDPEIADDPYAYPDADIMAKCESYAGLPQNILDLYDSEWIRLKTTTGGQFWGLF
ncbi:MAG: spermidine/putrescine ABC transporter substrate-binding protein [Pseudoflavonifractor capillosus]|uniref:ABC transporter substrate-binding protein n=1 Tax=Pseudoflavonifractor capillosus TaxID=106588 RepID=UPI0023FA3670|nr:spermidine/putrescine ABC transporter substrate-binding protein [Pseudoflavonifractor capillosus]MCI5928479.1 spermidine/putrescine ABC transporter substrate-binding protein [Pseudoflavonifractor capillosus]MDY4661397.1 spermidine/putrescine ABC transporter substrate-binding protein [Pseudoflavonifractor capillosus]